MRPPLPPPSPELGDMAPVRNLAKAARILSNGRHGCFLAPASPAVHGPDPPLPKGTVPDCRESRERRTRQSIGGYRSRGRIHPQDHGNDGHDNRPQNYGHLAIQSSPLGESYCSRTKGPHRHWLIRCPETDLTPSPGDMDVLTTHMRHSRVGEKDSEACFFFQDEGSPTST